jgi:diadenosine tetraphosphate (Ap4A) HIT family hydrolase
MQEMDPYDAKKLFEDLQASVKVDLSGIEESEKTITADGYTIKLNIVRPQGEEGNITSIHVYPWRWLDTRATIRHTNE